MKTTRMSRMRKHHQSKLTVSRKSKKPRNWPRKVKWGTIMGLLEMPIRTLKASKKLKARVLKVSRKRLLKSRLLKSRRNSKSWRRNPPKSSLTLIPRDPRKMRRARISQRF